MQIWLPSGRLSAHAVPTQAPVLPYRVGHGFDLHRMAEGHELIIGGKKIEHYKGCEAHSDGDVLLHCITDAILGVICMCGGWKRM
jgi:2-C-methyl-D-erythritol 2,4-cyclodiphosphate synthase